MPSLSRSLTTSRCGSGRDSTALRTATRNSFQARSSSGETPATRFSTELADTSGRLFRHQSMRTFQSVARINPDGTPDSPRTTCRFHTRSSVSCTKSSRSAAGPPATPANRWASRISCAVSSIGRANRPLPSERRACVHLPYTYEHKNYCAYIALRRFRRIRPLTPSRPAERADRGCRQSHHHRGQPGRPRADQGTVPIRSAGSADRECRRSRRRRGRLEC